MRDRGFIFLVHRLGRIRLRASRCGGQGPRPTSGSDTPRVGNPTSDLRPPTSDLWAQPALLPYHAPAAGEEGGIAVYTPDWST